MFLISSSSNKLCNCIDVIYHFDVQLHIDHKQDIYVINISVSLIVSLNLEISLITIIYTPKWL